MKSNTVLLAVLHILASFLPFVGGLLMHLSLPLGCLSAVIGSLFMTAILSRAFRIDDEYEMMRIALEDPQDAPTDPMIPVAEPVTGVKHKTISEPPRIVTWHGKRGNG